MVYPIIHGSSPLPTTVDEIYKADAHVHLQAVLFEYRMRKLARARGLDFDALAKGYPQQKWANTFAFHQEYESLYGKLMKDPEDYYFGVYDYLKRSAQENAVLVELSGSLRPPTPGKIDNHHMLLAIEMAFRDAEAEFGIKAGFIANIVRDFGPEHAMWVARQAVELQEESPFIVGLGMSGDENCHNPPGNALELYVPAYEFAHANKLGCTIHAGETNFESFENTMRVMGHVLDRVGHGIHALKATNVDALKDYIRRHPKHRELYLGEPKNPNKEPHCVLEFCPSSYAKLQSWDGEIKELVHGLWNAGYRILVGSDDPGPMQTSIGNEYKILHEKYDMGLGQLSAMTTATIKRSFLPKKDIAILYMRASRQKHLLLDQQADLAKDGWAPTRMRAAFGGQALRQAMATQTQKPARGGQLAM